MDDTEILKQYYRASERGTRTDEPGRRHWIG